MSKTVYEKSLQAKFDKIRESEIRYRITCLEIKIGYVEKVNHFNTKYKTGILYEKVEDLLVDMEVEFPNWTRIEKHLSMIETLFKYM